MNSASIGSISSTSQNVNSQNKETSEQFQARKANNIDGYTEKEYNKRGWAFMFTNEKMNDPSISQVIKIVFEHETDIAPIREQLVRYLQEGLSYEHIVEIFESYAGQKIFGIYQLGDFTNHLENRESSSKHKGGSGYSLLDENRTGSIGENSSQISTEIKDNRTVIHFSPFDSPINTLK